MMLLAGSRFFLWGIAECKVLVFQFSLQSEIPKGLGFMVIQFERFRLE